MEAWEQIVTVLRDAMFVYAQASNGNLAVGIMAVTFLARLALFPLTLRLARSAARQQEILRRIQPAIDALKTKFKDDPRRQMEETQRVFKREGTSMIPAAGCMGGLALAPVLLALFAAVRQCADLGGRFLWIRDLSRPDVLLTIMVTALTAGAIAAGPPLSPEQRVVMLIVPTVMTAIMLSQMSAGVGLYWGVSSAIGVAQAYAVKASAAPRPR